MARFNMTYHGSPSAQSIMNQGFRPGGIMSVAPGQVFSTPNYGFASGYGKPVGMVTSKSAFSMPSMNFSTGNLGSEVVQNPKTATRGMNLANKLGTTYTSPRAQSLMAGKTVSGLGASAPGNFMKALGIMGSLPAQAALMSLSPTPANADEINMGPEDFSNLAAAEAAANIQGLDLNDYEQSITANEPMDIEDFLGTSTPQDLGFIGNAPSIREAVAPVGITDRGRSGAFANPGEMGAYEMIGGTPVAIGDVLGMQQALEKSNIMDEPTQGINYNNLGILGTIGGLLTGSTALKALGMFGNYKSGRTGRALGAVSKGLGSLGSRFAGTMRGINPITGKPNTQAQYEANREAARTQNRIDNMLDRKAKGKNYSEKNLSDLIGQQIAGREDKSGSGKKSGFTNPGTNSYGPHKGSDNGGDSGGGKIVCTMMNERYGFGSFRNKIWMKFHEHHGPEYQKGYHAIFLPLVKIAKGEGKINTAVRKVLEHMGRHVTADMFKIMKGKKRDTLGRIYRAIFEPACHIIGKIKSALGRG